MHTFFWFFTQSSVLWPLQNEKVCPQLSLPLLLIIHACMHAFIHPFMLLFINPFHHNNLKGQQGFTNFYSKFFCPKTVIIDSIIHPSIHPSIHSFHHTNLKSQQGFISFYSKVFFPKTVNIHSLIHPTHPSIPPSISPQESKLSTRIH